MKEIPLTKGMVTLVDDADYDELIRHKWWFRDLRNYSRIGYAARSKRTVMGRKTIMMHRQIMGLNWDTSIQVDHIDGNGLNNQKSNLRICNNSQNHMNKPPPRNNTTGYTGIYLDPRNNRYYVYINVNRKRYYFRSYVTFEEAKQARISAEIKHFGEFRRNQSANIS